MKKKVLFIDRDGTILQEPEDFQIDSFQKMRYVKDVVVCLSRIAKETDYVLVLVSNQDGLGTDSFALEDFWPVQNAMIQLLESQGVSFADIFIDPSLPSENSINRKPGIGMLSKYVYGQYDLENSFVIGDRLSDLQLAKNLGAKSIVIVDPTTNTDIQGKQEVALFTKEWQEIYTFLKGQYRTARVQRKTKETDIEVMVNLDWSKCCDIQSGLGFFDHMLAQIQKHGNIGLQVKVKGDLWVDEHHTIEDTALALGQAFQEALGSKKAIERYGFSLPMDDALTSVAIDFSNRPFLVWDADFKREKVGDMPCEMFSHFFESFCQGAGCNLNIKATGDNEHHKIESIFKCFAKALRLATSKNQNYSIPSSKGVL